jgi:pimeloyl-ACP methyl ester carboxylesterase
MPLFDTKAVQFNYEMMGEAGPTFVFISGYTCDINFWRPVANRLAETARVLIFDNQGIGRTTDSGSDLTIESMAGQVKALLDGLGIHSAIIVGFAMGGNIAQQLAYRHPELCEQLVLLSTTIKWGDVPVQKMEELIALREEVKTDQLIAKCYELALGSAYKTRVSLEQFRAQMLSAPESQTLEGQKRQFNALKQFDSAAWIAGLTMPVHIISPLEDQFALLVDMQRLAYALRTDCHTLACGHSVLMEEPGALFDLVSNSIKSHNHSTSPR